MSMSSASFFESLVASAGDSGRSSALGSVMVEAVRQLALAQAAAPHAAGAVALAPGALPAVPTAAVAPAVHYRPSFTG